MSTAEVYPLCSENDPELWFADERSGTTAHAKRICEECELLLSCRQYALDVGVPEGVWGGWDAEQRHAYWRTHGGRPNGFRRDLELAIGTLRSAEQREGVA